MDNHNNQDIQNIRDDQDIPNDKDIAAAQAKIDDAYKALDVIDAYVKNNGGTCKRTEANPVEK